MFGFDSKDVFFVFPSFFVLKWKKQTTHFFFKMDMINQDLKKQKKLKFFFCFFSILGLVFCIETYQKSKQLEFFCFFEVLVDSMYANNQKTQVFFWFLAFETRKNKNNLGKTTQKKQSFESKPTILLKVFFCFLFFWFPRHPQDFWLCFFCFSKVFVVLVILEIYKYNI